MSAAQREPSSDDITVPVQPIYQAAAGALYDDDEAVRVHPTMQACALRVHACQPHAVCLRTLQRCHALPECLWYALTWSIETNAANLTALCLLILCVLAQSDSLISVTLFWLPCLSCSVIFWHISARRPGRGV